MHAFLTSSPAKSTESNTYLFLYHTDTAFISVGSPYLRGSTKLIFLSIIYRTRNEFSIDSRGLHFCSWRFLIILYFLVYLLAGFHKRRSRSHRIWSIENNIVGVADRIKRKTKPIILLYSRYRDFSLGLFHFWFSLRHRQSTPPRVYRRFGTCPANFFFWLRWSISGGFVSRIEGKWKRSDSSNYDSAGLMTPFSISTSS